uniref:Uncharacterized protein n=1 Tax=Romanomermis culicivorax TaxID=13658 RepID=A0A915HYK7_ROMCU
MFPKSPKNKDWGANSYLDARLALAPNVIGAKILAGTHENKECVVEKENGQAQNHAKISVIIYGCIPIARVSVSPECPHFPKVLFPRRQMKQLSSCK